MGRADQGVSGSEQRHRVIPRVLCFVTHGSDVLLLQGGPGKRLWAGLYNGLGGHLEAGEDVQSAVLREVKEESGLDVHAVRLRCVVHADAGDPLTGILFFVFTAVASGTQVVPSREGELAWFPIAALPAAGMVEDLPILLPRVFAMGPTDPPFFAHYAYDDRDRLIVRIVEPQ